MKPEQQRQAYTDIPPEIEAIAGEGIKLFSRQINVDSKSMTDLEFDHLCEAHSFGAVARNEFPLVPRAMLKALVDAAVSTEILKQQERIKHSVTDEENLETGWVLQPQSYPATTAALITQLKYRIKQLEAVTNDPHALWANWLRGNVKLPEGIGDVRQYQDRIKQLEEQLWLTLNEPHTPDAFMGELLVRKNLYGAKPHTKERP